MNDTTIMPGTSLLDVIASLGLDFWIEWPPEPVLTERERLMQRLLVFLDHQLLNRFEALDE